MKTKKFPLGNQLLCTDGKPQNRPSTKANAITVSAMSVGLFIAVAAGIVGCNKNDRGSSLVADKSNAKVAKLVEDAHRIETAERIAEITEEYQALSTEELTNFWTLKNDRDAKELEEMRLRANPHPDEAEKNLINDQIQALRDARMSLLKLSLQKLGKPFNKIDHQEFKLLIAQVLQEDKYSILDVNFTSAVRAPKANAQNAVLACGPIYYPGNATETIFTGGTGYYATHRLDDDPDVTPCDFEHRFNGSFRYIRGERAIDSWAIASDPAKRSLNFSDGVDTAILVGYGDWLINVAPGNLYARMKN